MKKKKAKRHRIMICNSMSFYLVFLKHRKITFHTKKQTKSAQKICKKHIKMFETQKIH